MSTPKSLRYHDVIAELAALGIYPHPYAVKDARYVIISHQWLVRQFLPGWVSFVRRFYTFEAEGADCDDFSHGFLWKLRKALKRSGNASLGGVPAAEIQVEQRNAWANVSAGGAHALVLLRTSQGWFALEPQNGIHTPWQMYPNKEFVRQDATTF